VWQKGSRKCSMLIGGSYTNRRGESMKKTDLIEFLEFRSKFTNREWNEINRCVEFREREKAAQTKLDDLDKKIILERIRF